jgi:hypothetical protein
VHINLVAGMSVKALPFSRTHDEALHYDMLVLQQHLTAGIVQRGVGQQELLIGFRRLP